MKAFIDETGSVTSPLGFRAAAVAGTIKYADRLDTTLVVSEVDCSAAAVFTQNQVAAAPVLVSREIVRANPNKMRAVVANSGNANAVTGEQGLKNARRTQKVAAQKIGCHPDQILLLSTGVIGVQLPMEKLEIAVEMAARKLSREGGRSAAEAIMTTDTRPKQASITVELAGQPVIIGGMAKGAGMIHPNMATMLGVLTTDAEMDSILLTELLQNAVNQSFNRISIDGDTSTNDTVLMLANGRSGKAISSPETVQIFQQGLIQLCSYLAREIVKDGEGATKFVTIQVVGSEKNEDAHQIANTIAISPLVKTAFAGSDPNWGRLLMAAGRAGVRFDQNKLDLWIGSDNGSELQLLAQSTPTGYEEAAAAAIFAQDEFYIRLDLHQGDGEAAVWTTDLSHAYVSINADYRT